MTEPTREVVAGFDCHLDTNTGVVIDALAWLGRRGKVIAVGVESTGAYGAGLTRHLQAHGVTVLEVNRPHAHTRARRGKSDPIDAEAAARRVLSGEATCAAKDTSGIVEAIRQVTVARNGAVKARAAALCQLGDLIVTAPVALRERLSGPASLAGRARLCARLRPNSARGPDPTRAAKLALRSIARRIGALDAELATLDAELEDLITVAAPHTLSRLGVGPCHAATLLAAAGENIERLHSEAAFAHLCAAAPIPASSGRTSRHRLNYAGNRQANRALHMIAIVRLRYCPTTQTYLNRRLAEGRTKNEAIRCLKRYIARDIYKTLRADLATLQTRLDNL